MVVLLEFNCMRRIYMSCVVCCLHWTGPLSTACVHASKQYEYEHQHTTQGITLFLYNWTTV